MDRERRGSYSLGSRRTSFLDEIPVVPFDSDILVNGNSNHDIEEGGISQNIVEDEHPMSSVQHDEQQQELQIIENAHDSRAAPRRLRSVDLVLEKEASEHWVPPKSYPLCCSRRTYQALGYLRGLGRLILQNMLTSLAALCALLSLVPLMSGNSFSLKNSSLERALLDEELRNIVLACLTLTIPIWVDLILDLITHLSVPNFTLDWYEWVSRIILQFMLVLPMIIIFASHSNSVGIAVLFVSLVFLQITTWAGVILSLLQYYSPSHWTLLRTSTILLMLTSSYLLDFTYCHYKINIILILANILRFTSFILFILNTIQQNYHVRSMYAICQLSHKHYSSLVIGFTGSCALLCYAVQPFFMHDMIVANATKINLNWYFGLLSVFIMLTTVLPGRSARYEAIQLRQNLEIKRTFVRYVSHEVRTPLNTICMGLEMLETEMYRSRAKPDTIETVGQLKEAAVVAVETLSDLLLYEKIDSGIMALELAHRLPDVFLAKACEPFQLQARAKDISLVVLPPLVPIPGSLLIDDKKMAQVVRNFVSNALKFTPTGGRVEVSLALSLTDLVPVKGNGQVLRIEVKDSGFGISAENQRKVFNEIVQFHANKQQGGGGSGLGLWISKKIVELHSGKVGLFSEGEGKGSVFYLDLPLFSNAPEVVEPIEPIETHTPKRLEPLHYPHGSAQPSPLLERKRSSLVMISRLSSCEDGNVPDLHIVERVDHKYRILVVDDSELNRKMMLRSLRASGHDCKEADDGLSASALFTGSLANRDDYDVILMDNFMPGLSGMAATKLIRAAGFKGFVIGVTGDAMPSAIAEFLAHGADMVLVKPMKVTVFESAMEELSAARQLKNAIASINKSRKALLRTSTDNAAEQQRL